MPEPAPEQNRPRRREQADTRREQLLEAALDTFSRKGVEGSTIRDIAKAAGVTEGLIYHYFESKSALLAAVIERYAPVPEMASLVDALAPVPTREAFKAMCHGLLRLYLERRRFMVLMVTETQRNDEVAAILARILGGAIAKARAFVQDRIDRGELRPHDPMLTVRLLQGPIFFYFLMQPRLSPPLPALEADVLVNGIVDTVLHGLLVEPEKRS